MLLGKLQQENAKTRKLTEQLTGLTLVDDGKKDLLYLTATGKFSKREESWTVYIKPIRPTEVQGIFFFSKKDLIV